LQGGRSAEVEGFLSAREKGVRPIFTFRGRVTYCVDSLNVDKRVKSITHQQHEEGNDTARSRGGKERRKGERECGGKNFKKQKIQEKKRPHIERRAKQNRRKREEGYHKTSLKRKSGEL